MVLIHYREEQKLRMIERILKKPFVNRRVPSGRDVCEAQLATLLEKVRQVDTADGRLDAFMPVIDKVLAELPREEVVKRFILLDFDRFLANYKDAPDLNASVSHSPHGRYDAGDRRGTRRPEGRPDRTDRPERPERPDRPERGDRPAYRQRDPNVAKLRINLGRRNALTPPDLMALINRATPGPQLRIGRIHITEHASFFEMERQDAERVIPALNRTSFSGRDVQVVMETERGPGRSK